MRSWTVLKSLIRTNKIANQVSGTRSIHELILTNMKSQKNSDLVHTLQNRIESNMQRHRAIAWSDVLKRIAGNDRVVKVLQGMETTGGEPDVIEFDAITCLYMFCDCSAESPSGRRSF